MMSHWYLSLQKAQAFHYMNKQRMGYYSLKSVDIDCQGHQYGLSSNILRQRQMHLFLNNEHGIA